MKKIVKFLTFLFKSGGFLTLLVIGLFVLSLVAVSLSYLNYNSPIVPVCPTTTDITAVGATDSDGMVVHAAIRDGWRSDILLQGIIPAKEEGGALVAKISVLDTIPEDDYLISILFANDDPIPQTAVCKVMVTVKKQTTAEGGTQTTYGVKSRSRTPVQNEISQLTGRVLLGIVPGLAMLVIAALGGARFMTALYDHKLGLGLRFLIFRIFGRPSPKRPVIFISPEGEVMGDAFVKRTGGPGLMVVRRDNAKAVVLEQWGKLTRVAYGSAYVNLEPFERVWDVIDLRPQRWPFKVSAITQDGIPIDYEADVQFQIDIDDPQTAEANIFKAATCKWIRDANRTEPDRLMTWDKRVVIGATEGTLRSILARYKLDQLLEVECRREIRRQLHEALQKAAPNFGAKILDVTLRNVEFNGKALQQWFEQWQAQRDAKVQEVLAEGRARRIKEREKARNQVRQQMLTRTADILRELAKKNGLSLEQVSKSYVTLSFIEMLRNTASGNVLYTSDYFKQTLNDMRTYLNLPPEE